MLRLKVPRTVRLARLVLGALVVVLVVATLGGALVAVEIFSREPLSPVASTTHPTLSRKDCVGCHEPIAREWRESFHQRSLTGPYWADVRSLGYLDIFNKTRKACVNCHAPANVLDLPEFSSASASARPSLGVECTPNLLREPRGVIPAARADDVDLGVDCTSCHVSRRGILGTGSHPTEAHETIPDPRFQDPTVTAEGLCRTCHSATVEAWKSSTFANEGVTCLDCHMPYTNAPSVTGGPMSRRRSHRFPADKDPSLLARAVNASLVLDGDRKALFRITNDRVGHFLPSGGNWLSLQLNVRDDSGRLLNKSVVAYGRDEALLLDFWPFNRDHRIAPGERKDVVVSLPEGHGTVEAVVRYHDWMKVKSTVATLEERF